MGNGWKKLKTITLTLREDGQITVYESSYSGSGRQSYETTNPFWAIENVLQRMDLIREELGVEPEKELDECKADKCDNPASATSEAGIRLCAEHMALLREIRKEREAEIEEHRTLYPERQPTYQGGVYRWGEGGLYPI